ncbi:MAG: hypothetical protein EPN93_17240 [Spirochaetes bacterium]|nr:MAG: hypothetical protein EPN93_17240 [Spirochaetota bacterium]
MKIAGVSIVLVLGIINMVLIVFQMLTGYHKIKTPFRMHRKAGIALLCCALAHAVLAALSG